MAPSITLVPKAKARSDAPVQSLHLRTVASMRQVLNSCKSQDRYYASISIVPNRKNSSEGPTAFPPSEHGPTRSWNDLKHILSASLKALRHHEVKGSM